MKETPPAPGTAKNILYPEVPSAKLSNGLTVLTVEDHHLPRIVVRLGFPVGRVDDPEEFRGLTQLAVDMLKEGTEQRDSQEIAETLDQHAVHFDYQVLAEQVHLSVTALAAQIEPALDLMSEMVLCPAFPESEFQKVKARWMSQIMAQRSDSTFLANQRLLAQLFPGHPYANISVAEKTLESVGVEQLRDHFLNCFCAPGGIIVFAGSVAPHEAFELANRFFGKLPERDREMVPYPRLMGVPRNICLVHRAHSAQAEILIGTRTLCHSDPSYLPLKLTNQVLGGGASSRLFLNLREDKGYTYGAYSYLRSFREDGAFFAGANVKSEATAQALEETYKELKLLQESEPSAGELARSRAELGGVFIRQMETPSSIATLELVKRLDKLPADYYQNFLPNLEAVNGQEVKRMARRHLDPDRMVSVVVGDRKTIEPSLRERGTLEVFDVEGNLIA